ncbi:MAG: branched-chain amino acid ABC transporter permease [Paracoccaceae bacterium]
MIYREAGDFSASYKEDSQTFPIRFDRMAFYVFMAVAFLVVPFIINDYWANAVLLPFLIYAIAALGLNILTGYTGLVSLGSGGFMAVGAFASYKLMTSFPDVNFAIHVILAGFITAGVGVLFGLPSLRIKGFYLAVATLAAQFFLVWLFNKVGWFFNYSPTGIINSPPRTSFGFQVTGPAASVAVKYLFCLSFATGLALIARNLTRGSVGRKWMAIRDMDIAAEIIGVNPLGAKLSAFAVSSFFIGIAGALFFSVYLGAVEVADTFSIQKSFLLLFMVIIGGLGSIFGSFAGAAFMVLFPVLMKNVLTGWWGWPTDLATHVEVMSVGLLIVIFLIVEPHGLARLWRITKEKLRLWPFPH